MGGRVRRAGMRGNPWLGLQVGLSRLGTPCVAGGCTLSVFVLLHGALHPVEKLLCGEDTGLVLCCT